MPTRAEWLEVWQGEGGNGGMKCRVVDWEAKQVEYEEAMEQEGGRDPYNRQWEKADRGVERLRNYVAKAPKRKEVPEETAPAELWCMVLDPGKGIDRTKFRVGM